MSQSVKENLLAAFRYLLKPLVRLALKNGVVFPEFSEVLKQSYVDVASKQQIASGKEPTEDGVSLIASIDRSEVASILRSDGGAKFGLAAQKFNPLPTVLAAWHTDQRYTGPYGVLRELEFSRNAASDISAATFSDLAANYCPGISPQVLLDELIRTKCVQSVGGNFYRPVKRSYIPDPLSAASILLVARVVHNICQTLEVNLRVDSIGGKGLIERSVYTVHGITKKDLELFDKYIRVRGQSFADEIDNWLSSKDQEGHKDRIQTGVGFYHYIVNEEDERALSEELLN